MFKKEWGGGGLSREVPLIKNKIKLKKKEERIGCRG